jgi:hypothetical protein
MNNCFLDGKELSLFTQRATIFKILKFTKNNEKSKIENSVVFKAICIRIPPSFFKIHVHELGKERGGGYITLQCSRGLKRCIGKSEGTGGIASLQSL